jgi:hypothetical protein
LRRAFSRVVDEVDCSPRNHHTIFNQPKFRLRRRNPGDQFTRGDGLCALEPSHLFPEYTEGAMTAPEHSSLPWRYDSPSGTIWDADDKLVLSVSENQRAIANARLIITAVNAHANLLAAAEEILGAWENRNGMGTLYNMTRAIPSIHAAIARAEEPAP